MMVSLRWAQARLWAVGGQTLMACGGTASQVSAVFGSSALLGRHPGRARGRKSVSSAGWGYCGRCMR